MQHTFKIQMLPLHEYYEVMGELAYLVTQAEKAVEVAKYNKKCLAVLIDNRKLDHQLEIKTKTHARLKAWVIKQHKLKTDKLCR